MHGPQLRHLIPKVDSKRNLIGYGHAVSVNETVDPDPASRNASRPRLPPDHPYQVPPGYSAPDSLPSGHPGEASSGMPGYPVVHPGSVVLLRFIGERAVQAKLRSSTLYFV